MKRIALFALLLFALLAAAEAQPKRARGRAGSIREADQKTVDAAQVPEAVRQAQNVAFPGFKQDSRTTRARYDSNGKSLAVTKFFTANDAPQVVTSAAARYTGYSFVGGEEVLTDKGTFYRARFRQGAKKLTVFLDQTGAAVEKKNQPKLLDIKDEGN